jgi:uncharacterized protein (TIGR03435 family)
MDLLRGLQIEAITETHQSTAMIQGPMLQAILEDRFKLKLHRDTKEGPVYSLTLGKGSSKLKPFEEGSCIKVQPLPVSSPSPGQRYCDDLISARNPASINAEEITLNELCQLLDLVMDRPVIDNTGITGKYDFHLSFSRDESTSQLPPLPEVPSAASEPTDPTIFTAVQEQLGLKLVATKGPVEALVIDHVEKPSPN